MNPFDEQLKNAVKQVRLSEGERAQLHAVLLREMASVRDASVKRHQTHAAKFKRRSYRNIMPIALLIALLMSGSVSYAAEGSLPGDTLYPVKIHVNESVRGAFALDAAAKAKFEAGLAERRLAEAEELEHASRLDASSKSALKASFSDHRGRAESHLKEVERNDKEDADRINSEFKVRLSEHTKTLGLLEIELDDDHDEDDFDDESEHGSNLSGTTTTNIQSDDHDDGIEVEIEHGIEVEIEHEIELNEHSSDDRRGRDDDEDDEEDDNRGAIQLAINPPVTLTPAPAPSPTPTPAPAPTPTVKTFTLAEVATHNNNTSCYTTINGGVYNVTSFIGAHPGGAGAILSICGKDGTALFMAQHSGDAKPESTLASFKVGVLAQ